MQAILTHNMLHNTCFTHSNACKAQNAKYTGCNSISTSDYHHHWHLGQIMT